MTMTRTSAPPIRATRAENVAEAQRLQADGLSTPEVAERMSAKYSTVWDWLNDPDGAKHKARRLRYGGQCVDCGARTDGSRGPTAGPSERCSKCAGPASRIWTEKEIVAAIQRFAERYDRPPAAADFNPPQALNQYGHKWRAERFHRDGDYPHVKQIQDRFGSWNAAIAAAGFLPQKTGTYPRDGQSGTHLADEREAA